MKKILIILLLLIPSVSACIDGSAQYSIMGPPCDIKPANMSKITAVLRSEAIAPAENITLDVTPTATPTATLTATPTNTLTATRVVTNNSSVTQANTKRPTIILTFDDGWLTVYTRAYPILKANNQSGVAFTNIEPVLGEWPDFMPKADLDELYKSGWDISSHTYSHVDLTLQNESLLKHELYDSKVWLDTSGYTRSSMFIAYPYGSYNANVTNALKTYEYVAARTVIPTSKYTHYTLNS